MNWTEKRELVLTKGHSRDNQSIGHADGRRELDDDTFKFYFSLAEMIRPDLREQKGEDMGRDAEEWVAWLRSDGRFYFG